ncbi:hypothetical protein Q9R32_01390 [Actinotalea sp. AC32]|nr:hypothetical protein [Actinotalea sp. AC32]
MRLCGPAAAVVAVAVVAVVAVVADRTHRRLPPADRRRRRR